MVMTHKRKIGKMGNSLAIPITSELKDLNYSLGDTVHVNKFNGVNIIVIGPKIDSLFELFLDKEMSSRFNMLLKEENEGENINELKLDTLRELVGWWIKEKQTSWYESYSPPV